MCVAGNERHGTGITDGDPDFDARPRGEEALRIGDRSADADGAGLLVDLIVDEIEDALVREILLGFELELERKLGRFECPGSRLVCLSLAQVHALVALHGTFVDGKVDVDWSDGNDGGQDRDAAAGVDEVSDAKNGVADAAGSGCSDLGI